MKTLYSLLFVIALSSLSIIAQVNVGEEAPNFRLAYLGGGLSDRIELDELEGKVVYIFFYGASCPHCLSNGPVTESEIYQSFVDEENFVALGLDAWNQSATVNTNFKNQTGITYSLLLNGRDALVSYYGSAGFYDRSIVVGADGILKYKGNSFVNQDFEAVKTTISTELEAIATSSETDEVLPTDIRLNQNYPNPFNPSTTISYTLSSPSNVKLQVYNILGNQVATLVDEFQAGGQRSISWNASSVPSGVYMYRLTAGDQVLTRRMMLIK